MTHKVIISSVTPTGVYPQFYAERPTKAAAQDYANEFRKLAAQAGVLIRVDFEEALAALHSLPASRDELKARDEIKREVRK